MLLIPAVSFKRFQYSLASLYFAFTKRDVFFLSYSYLHFLKIALLSCLYYTASVGVTLRQTVFIQHTHEVKFLFSTSFVIPRGLISRQFDTQIMFKIFSIYSGTSTNGHLSTSATSLKIITTFLKVKSTMHVICRPILSSVLT